MRRSRLLLILLAACGVSTLQAQTVTTFAGVAGSSGTTNGTGTATRFNTPHAIATDKSGNIYVADRLNNVIRKITSAGVVTTFAGSGSAGAVDALGTAASFFEPYGITCDTSGNVYVADTKNFKIRKITPAGLVSTVAGQGVFGTTNGPANNARFGYPVGIAVTPDGSTIYVSDYNTHVIRQISAGNVTTLAGMIYVTGNTNGSGNAATFNHPTGLCLTPSGELLIADEWNNQLRKMTASGLVTTVAGTGFPGSADGAAVSATFNGPTTITLGAGGNYYIADALNHTLRAYNPTTQVITTYAGSAGLSGSSDGSIAVARFNTPYGISYSNANYALYCSDQLNHTIRKIISLSTISLTVSTTTSTVCSGDSILFTITPFGLSNYTLEVDGITYATSATNTIKIGPLLSGNHSIICTAIDSTGALATGSPISINVLPPFVPMVAASAVSFCPGDSATLTAQSGSSYLWSGGQTTASIVVKTTGNYSVTLTNASGCTGISVPVAINVLPTTPVTFTPANPQVCPGTTLSLSVNAGTSYSWSSGATTAAITAGVGVYAATVTQSNGCKTSASVTVSNYAVTNATIIPSTTQQLFPGDSVLLTANGGASYVWNNGATTAALYINQAGTYSVIATNSNGCTSTSAPVQIIPFNTATMVLLNGLTPFCEDDSTYLLSAFASGNQWYCNAQPLVGETNQTLYPSQTGYYQVRVAIGNNLVYSDSLYITVWPTPAEPQLQDTTICSGYSVQLTASSIGNLTVRWYNADINGQLLYTGNPFTTGPISTYTEYFAETVSPEGCVSASREMVVVDVLPSPVADFSYTTNYTAGNWEVQFTELTTGAATINWLFGDTGTSALPNPVYTYSQSGQYDVTLIATAANGCVDSVQKAVGLYNNTKNFVPTTFTPNGDGKNDIFRVRGERVIVEDMRIFSQWGTLLWQGKEANAQWDGMSGGAIVPNGSYFYRIRITDQSGAEQELTGTVTVIK
jgi:gliding motility-associated-like protein